jgi:NitT/TauT family transport system ATP-binding protein
MIEIVHVSHQFGPTGNGKEPLLVLDDVNVMIPDGMFVSFLGPSGCGKTTLLRIIDGLVKASSGVVVVDGTIGCRPSADRAMVFQEFNLLPWRTVLANAELGLEVQGVDRSRRSRLASDALERVGLGAFRHHYPHELSGGMKQLVGLARALCTRPRYLLMDEPFGSLDPQVREMMQIELLKIWEADRKTVVFVTHSVEEAVFLSDRIVVLSARPARVLETVNVHLPRPRWTQDAAIRGSEAFLRYRQRIWNLLRRELESIAPLASPVGKEESAVASGHPNARLEHPD